MKLFLLDVYLTGYRRYNGGIEMKFKTGDKVMVKTPSWQEECRVIKGGWSSNIIFVRRANGCSQVIYKYWASIIIPKNTQLLFDFWKK